MEELPTKLRPKVGGVAKKRLVKQPQAECALAGPPGSCRRFSLARLGCEGGLGREVWPGEPAAPPPELLAVCPSQGSAVSV